MSNWDLVRNISHSGAVSDGGSSLPSSLDTLRSRSTSEVPASGEAAVQSPSLRKEKSHDVQAKRRSSVFSGVNPGGKGLLRNVVGFFSGVGWNIQNDGPAVEESPRTTFDQRAVLGEIAFQQGVTSYCIVRGQVDANEIVENLLLADQAWDLDVPKLVLSVMGGAGKMDMDKEDVASFSKGLVEAALKTSAWVITGGTKSGVMDMVGKAMQEHDKYHQVPCIGITAFGAMTRRWRDLLNTAPPLEADASGDLADPKTHKVSHKVDWRQQVDAGHDMDEIEMDIDESGRKHFLVQPQDNHTHTILVDNETTGHKAFATEADFRARLEEFAGKLNNPPVEASQVLNGIAGTESARSLHRMGSESRSLSRIRSHFSLNDMLAQRLKVQEFNSIEIPRVMILVNGGQFSLDHLDKAISHDCPLVVCKGTGRLADTIVTLCERKLEVAQNETNENDTNKLRKLQQDAIDGAYDEAVGKLGNVTEEQKEMIYRIVQSELVEIFNSKKERLEDVILRAVIDKKKWSSSDGSCFGVAVHQLLLAVEWRCTEQLAKICKSLMEGFKDKRDGITKLLETMRSSFKQDRMHGGSDTGPGWGPVMTWLLKNHRKDLENYEFREKDRSIIRWRGTNRSSYWKGAEGLFIWAIETEAPEAVIEAIWMCIEDPVHACLVGASVCRQTIQDIHSSDSYKDNLAKERLEDYAIKMEKIATNLIQDVAVTRGESPIIFLFKSSRRWGGSDGYNCFHLAHTLGCKLFVSSGVYKLAVDLYWMTPAPFDVNKKPLDASLLQWQKLFQALGKQLLMLPRLFHQSLRNREPEDEVEQFFTWQLWSVPRVKALTHGLSRFMFLIIYSLAVFTGRLADGDMSFYEPVLFVWGIGYALVEVKQFQQKQGAAAYFSDTWNCLDFIHISILLLALIASFVLGDNARKKSKIEYSLELAHAVNLLPSYMRALQSFQLSEYFGTLLMTVLGMCKDALYFFALLVIFCLAFSSALTPILWPENEDRWKQGVTWAFWSIFGEVSDAKERLANVENTFLRYLAHSLLFMLSLISSTLLANLLIALMNNTYEEQKYASELEWAFNRVDTVLEFNEGADLPPPFNLLEAALEYFQTRNDRNGAEKKPKLSRPVLRGSQFLRDAQGKALELCKFAEERDSTGDKVNHNVSRRLSEELGDTPVTQWHRGHTSDSEGQPVELQQLKNEINEVQRQNSSVRDENIKLLKENRDLRILQEELYKQISRLERSCDAAKSREERREEEVQRLQQQLSRGEPPQSKPNGTQLDFAPSLNRQYETVEPLPPTPTSSPMSRVHANSSE